MHPPIQIIPLLALLALLPTTTAVAEEERIFVDEPSHMTSTTFKEPEKWKEKDVRLPTWPRDADLVEIKVDDPDPSFTYYLDTRSLSTGTDGVVRYTVIAESDSGARNVTFEGLRCTLHGKYKVYAYGIGDQFNPTEIAEEWRTVDPRGTESFRFDLWRHYLCLAQTQQPRRRNEQVRLLKSGRVPHAESTVEPR